MDIEFLLSKPKGRCNARYVKKNYPEEYNKIILLKGDTFSERLYNYIYNSPTHICPVCGKETRFYNITTGYHEFCSSLCGSKSNSRMEKIKRTCLEKYGVDNPSKLSDVKKKIKDTTTSRFGGVGFGSKVLSEKSYDTILNKYGVDNPSKLSDVKKKKIETCNKHYEGGYKSKEIKDKTRKTCVEKYGVENILMLPEIKERAQQTIKDKMFKIHNNFLGRDEEGNWIIKCPHPECNKCKERCFVSNQRLYHDRKRNNIELCTKLLVPGKNNQGITIELFVRNILDKYNILYKTNVRDIIYPKELDIYIPEKKIAIECNGIFWHSKKDGEYHYNKFLQCQEKGIQLLSIWEDWIISKPEIVESIILSKLGIYKERIYARKCKIEEISSNKTTSFLNDNHIQGAGGSSIKEALVYNNEIVGVMTFSKKRGCMGNNEKKDGEWELSRFCTKKNTQVIGGAEKLLKYFIKTYKPTYIYSFSCNDISNGNLYEKLDFKKGESFVPYWYVDPEKMKRYHRTSFTKDNIVRKGIREKNDDSWTEVEVTSEIGLLKIYDSGMTKWTYI